MSCVCVLQRGHSGNGRGLASILCKYDLRKGDLFVLRWARVRRGSVSAELSYKALGRSIANYAAPVWSTNASDTSLGKIQRTQNEALRIIAGSHKMSSIDHLHSETKMLPVEDHLNLLSAQYLVHCLDTENVCHHITTLDHPPREMKETLFTRHNQLCYRC